MNLTYWDSYIAMYFFLQKQYFKYKWDDLGVLLGSIDPFLFEGGLPIDKSEVVVWLDIVKQNDILKEDLDEDEAFHCMRNFVEKKWKVRSWELESVVNHLDKIYSEKNESIEWTEWIDCCLKAKSENNEDD